jgi:hypothetical protein
MAGSVLYNFFLNNLRKYRQFYLIGASIFRKLQLKMFYNIRSQCSILKLFYGGKLRIFVIS